MTKQALNDWAIMNLSMEDRGQQPLEPEPAARGQLAVTAAGSFLTGELSYFGVCLHYRKPSAAPLFHTARQISYRQVICRTFDTDRSLSKELHMLNLLVLAIRQCMLFHWHNAVFTCSAFDRDCKGHCLTAGRLQECCFLYGPVHQGDHQES